MAWLPGSSLYSIDGADAMGSREISLAYSIRFCIRKFRSVLLDMPSI